METFGTKYVNESIYDIMRSIAPILNNTLCSCSWQYNDLPCSEFFTAVITKEGICYNFNGLNSRDFYTEA